MINIEHTRNKLQQVTGRSVRLKGNDADKRRVLMSRCNKASIDPVEIGYEDV